MNSLEISFDEPKAYQLVHSAFLMTKDGPLNLFAANLRPDPLHKDYARSLLETAMHCSRNA